jgi:hypothetical protein
MLGLAAVAPLHQNPPPPPPNDPPRRPPPAKMAAALKMIPAMLSIVVKLSLENWSELPARSLARCRLP